MFAEQFHDLMLILWTQTQGTSSGKQGGVIETCVKGQRPGFLSHICNWLFDFTQAA